MEILILLTLFLILMFVGAPIVFSLGIPSMVYFFFMQTGNTPVEFIPHTMTGSMFNFVLIALPAFLLSGRMMNSAGVTNRLFDLSIAFVGWLRGGLAYANIFVSMLFASMSGTAVGDAGGLGYVVINMMNKAGYDKAFSAGITAASSVIGPVIPPSVAMVILGATAEISIGKLFMAGIIPGLIMTIALSIAVFHRAHFTEEGKTWPVEKVLFSRIPGIILRAFFPILTPVIIIGGINTGIVTPTEAAILAIDYSILLGIFYKELSLKSFIETLEETVISSGTFLFIIAVAGYFTWIITQMGLPMIIGNFLTPLTSASPIVAMLLLGAFFLVLGCFLDTTAAILLVTPTLMPIIRAAGLDPVHFGIVMVVALITGVITPPFGICLFVVADVAKIPVSAVTKEAVKYLPAMIVVLLLIIIFKDVVLWLPNLMF